MKLVWNAQDQKLTLEGETYEEIHGTITYIYDSTLQIIIIFLQSFNLLIFLYFTLCKAYIQVYVSRRTK